MKDISTLAAARRRPAPSGPQVTPAGFLFGPAGLITILTDQITPKGFLVSALGASFSHDML